MAVLSIKKYPDPILYKKAKEVTKIRKKTINLINNMIETMYSANGIGLAANQVGVLERIIIVDTTPKNEMGKNHRTAIVLINPEILSYEEENVADEGCLSLPGISGQIKRAQRIEVKGLNVQEETVEIEAAGLPARIIQHEIDHLNGILFIDQMDKEIRNSIKPQLEMLKRGKR